MDILQNSKPVQIPKRLGLDYWSNLILLLYILTMPFVSAFAFTGTLSMPLIFAVFLFILMLLKIIQSAKLPEGFSGFDLIILSLFLFLVVFSYLINGLGYTKSLNHTVAYLSTFLLFYITIKFTFFNIQDKNLLLKRTLQFITYTTIISALYGNVEFISSNAFGINLNDYIPRPLRNFYIPSVLGLYYRARGFAPESGHFAFMMELFSPLAVYYLYFSGFCQWPKIIKTLIVIAIVFSFLFAVSTASFVVIPASILVASILYLRKIYLYIRVHFIKFITSTSIVSIVFFLFNSFFPVYDLVILSISDKVDSGSFNDRKARLDFFYNNFAHLDFIHKLVGTGPAGYEVLGVDETNAILSLYHSFTFELGFLGLLLLLLLFVYVGLNTLKIKSVLGYCFIISLSSGMMHYYFISNFWYPWFWFIAVFAIFCSKFFVPNISKAQQNHTMSLKTK